MPRSSSPNMTTGCNACATSEQRLTEALRRHRELSAQDLLGAIVDEIRQFSPGEQYDDITLIVAKCRGASIEAS